MKTEDSYNKKYSGKDYYWGKNPSSTAKKLMKIISTINFSGKKMIDLGCGEGRDAVFYAKKGFEVLAIDISEQGLKKAEKYAKEENLKIKIVKENIIDYRLEERYDIIISTGVLHYLPPRQRTEKFQNYKKFTNKGGINAFSVFVKKPFIEKAPDADPNAYFFKSGELMTYYWDWEILYCTEEIFDCNSSNIPHKHAVNRIIARKP
jgi:tellurite methyltransferase